MGTHDLGLLGLRLGLGTALAAHGAQKLFGWFGGGGLPGTTGAMEAMGFRPGARNAVLAGTSEAGGGALLALGLATGPAGGAVAGTMAVAGSVHASGGFFATAGGYELAAVYGWAASMLALTGPGRYSLDEVTGNLVNRPWMSLLTFAGAAASAAALIRQRRPVIDQAPAQPDLET